MRRYRFRALLSVLVLLGVAFSRAAAQGPWHYIGSPQGGTVTSLAKDKSGRIFAGTDLQGLFRSTDDGGTWEHIGGEISESEVSIHAISDGTLFAITGNGRLFRSVDGGGNWTAVATGSNFGPVMASDASGALLAAAAGNIVRSTDNGEHWAIVDNVAADGVRTVIAIAAGAAGVDYAIIGGFDYLGHTYLKRSTDGGVTWSKIDDTWLLTGWNSIGVAADGAAYVGTRDDGLLRSTDNGSTWFYVDVPDTSIREVAVSPDGVITCIVGRGVLRSDDGGKNWTTYPSGVATLMSRAVLPQTGGRILVGTEGAGLFHIASTREPWGVSGRDLLHGLELQSLAVGDGGSVLAVTNGRLHRSSDGGATWTDLYRSVAGPVEVMTTTPEGEFVIGNLAGLLRSSGHGSAWSVVAPMRARSCATSPDGRIYAADYEGHLYRSTDDGRTWNQFGSTTSDIAIATFYFDGTGNIVAATNSGAIFRISRETGELTELQSFRPGWISGLVGGTDGLVALSTIDGVVRSVDGGATWQAAGTVAPLFRPAELYADQAGTLYLTAYDGSGVRTVFRSTDRGSAWERCADGLSGIDVQALAMARDGSVYAATRAGLFKLDALSGVATSSTAHMSTAVDVEIYPNPAGASCSVRYRTSGSGPVRISLFDPIGREVTSICNGTRGPGMQSEELDLAGLVDGRYLLRIDAGGTVRVLPMVVLR